MMIDVVVEKDYEENLTTKKNRCYLYLTDELGYLKVWDLTNLIQKLGYNEAPNYP